MSRGLRLGNTSASSLISASNAQYNKSQTYQDQVVQNTFQNSAQTADDYNALKDHFTGRLSTVSDPSKALSFQKTMESARKSYTSNEIQRSSIAVQNGNGTPEDKLNAIAKFYGQAVQNGDMNQAQNLEQQYNSGVIALQNQQQADQARGVAAMKENNRILGENNVSSHNELAQQVADGQRLIQTIYNQGGQGLLARAAKGPITITNPDTGQKQQIDATSAFVQPAKLSDGSDNPKAGQSIKPDLSTLMYSIHSTQLGLFNSFAQDGSLSASERNHYATEAQTASNNLAQVAPAAQAVLNGQQPHGENVTFGADGNPNYSQTTNPIVGITRVKAADGSYSTVPQYDKNGVSAKDNQNNKSLYSSLKNSAEAKAAGITFDNSGNPSLSYVDGNGETVNTPVTPHGNGFVFSDPTSPTGLGILRNVNGQFKNTVEPLPANEANSDNFNTADTQFQTAQAQAAHDSSLPAQASRAFGNAPAALGKIVGGALNPGHLLDFAAQGVKSQQDAKQASDLQASLAQAQQIHQQSADALAALPHLNAPTPTYDAQAGRMNGPGALQVPAATLQAANTAGTPEFSQRFGFPNLSGTNNTPSAPAPAAPAARPSIINQVASGAANALKGVGNFFGFHF